MVSPPKRFVVTTTPNRVVTFSPKRSVIAIFNPSTSTVYWGTDTSLTAANGFPLPANQGVIFSRESGDDPTIEYFLVVEAGTAEVSVHEGYGKTSASLLIDLIKTLGAR